MDGQPSLSARKDGGRDTGRLESCSESPKTARAKSGVEWLRALPTPAYDGLPPRSALDVEAVISTTQRAWNPGLGLGRLDSQGVKPVFERSIAHGAAPLLRAATPTEHPTPTPAHSHTPAHHRRSRTSPDGRTAGRALHQSRRGIAHPKSPQTTAPETAPDGRKRSGSPS